MTTPEGDERSGDDDLEWEQLLEVLPDGVVVVDGDGIIRYLNGRAASLTGYASTELLGTNIERLVPTARRSDHAGLRRTFLAAPSTRTTSASMDLALERRDGSTLPVDIGLTPIVRQNGTWTVAVVRDDSARRGALDAKLAIEQESAEAIALSERRFRLSFENNTSGMLLVDPDGRIVSANGAFCEMLGWSEQEIVGRVSLELTHPDDRALTDETRREAMRASTPRTSYTKRFVHRDGRDVWAEVSRSIIEDESGGIWGFVSSVRDLTEERALISQLSHQALHDPLTGLANRALLEDRLQHALERSGRRGPRPAVAMLDLDDFKEVNDTRGHHIGDKLLSALATRLEEVIRAGDTIARFGGDEFCYLVEGLESEAEVHAVASRILGSLDRPFNVDDERFALNASLGIALGGEGATAEQLLQAADLALYEAKRRGKGRYEMFTPELAVRSVTHVELENELRAGGEESGLSLHFQPIVDLNRETVVALEGLVRWQHPHRGWVEPAEFIPVAERSELILALGEFVVASGCRGLATLSEVADGWPLFLCLNVSGRELGSPDFADSVEEALDHWSLGPDRLVLEISESAALEDVVVSAPSLAALRERGARLALDDFGAGYSSLNCLSRMRPDIIKIDPAFIGGQGDDAYEQTVLQTTIALGHQLGAVLVAEGIETREQLERVRRYGCDYGQGHFFSPAVALEDVEGAIARSLAAFNAD